MSNHIVKAQDQLQSLIVEDHSEVLTKLAKIFPSMKQLSFLFMYFKLGIRTWEL